MSEGINAVSQLSPVPMIVDSPSPRSGFAVSAYEQAASWLVALLVLIGFAVAILAAIWVTNKVHVPTRAVPVELVEPSGGGDLSVARGSGAMVDAPNLDDLAQQPELMPNSLPQLIASLPAAFAKRKAPARDVSLSGEPNTTGGGGGSGGRSTGPGSGEGRAGLTRAQRWEVQIGEGNTLAEYARQLDFFEIELGILGAGAEVVYLSRLSAAKPVQRSGARAAEQRLYMSWRRGSLRQADLDLARKAGISPEGKTIVQFLPTPVEEMLARLEHDFAGRQPYEIRRTQFAIRPRGGGYEFFVIEQLPLAVR